MQRSDILIILIRSNTKRGYYVYPSDIKKIFRVEMFGVVTQSKQIFVDAETEDEVWETLKDNPNVSLVDDLLMVDI